MAAQSQRRSRHPAKDFEALLRAAEKQGWRVKRGKGYFRALCSESCECSLSIVLTPSSSRTLVNTRKRFERCSGWRGEG
ncbi:MAG: hypothetical protein F4Y27_01370 [Acidimicrobiaceae bacterium]|nr:hypothetical protein [Acidimicrobiaceae bacterium]MXW76916.1 hypothetical protein [Acidimicrobiaceae bacterium]MYA73317.1 hypothetical protein [Acidimicrobiaceae bacterium]MYC41604.1 hypothetical protein [Acidimicrobiaceae bacterium]MYD05579.1 hypothetical protein [Acidimicrobiaceae bacterium]